MSNKKSNQWLRPVVAILTVLFLGLMITWPAIEFLLKGSSNDLYASAERLETLTLVRMRLINVFGYLWFFFFGATMGSFMNVVVWRMPRGKSVVNSPSNCPFCCTKIKAIDNVPVLGWLMLGGKCRACKLPISSRYPLVETLVGTVFVILLQVLLLSGGANLPGYQPSGYLGFSGVLFELDWNVLGPYAFFCLLCCQLIVWMLVAYDRQRIPKKSVVFAAVTGLVIPLIWPHLYIVSGAPINWSGFADPIRLTVTTTFVLGSLTGAVLGLGLRSARSICQVDSQGEKNLTRGWEVPVMLFAVGAYLGWQAVVTIAAISVLAETAILLLLKIKKVDQQPAIAGFLIAAVTLIYICCWKSFVGSPLWPSKIFHGQDVILPGVMLVLSAVGLRIATTRYEIDMSRFAKISDRLEKE